MDRARHLRTLAVVQARLGSTRLPGKVARPIGGVPLLGRVIAQLAACHELDGIVVATSDQPADRRLPELLPRDVPVYFGSEHDVLGRFVQALDAHEACHGEFAGVLRVCADNPFLDAGLIDHLIADALQRPEVDYATYGLRDGRPVVQCAVGVFAEWCRTSALRTAASDASEPADREHVTRYFYTHPEQFALRFLAMPAGLEREDLRLTVDLEEDWQHAEQICQALGPGVKAWPEIAAYVAQQPELSQRMAALNRAHRK